ncbi:MAG TPA: SAM-dependent methyltransferase [Elusimicrobia bacterium]|nr:SAM-dependent methyltransferase [Elusimicrobiota bacterium]HBT62704.1 SAM-dependent methyltransferase [Elusimicrobiota bacterium]
MAMFLKSFIVTLLERRLAGVPLRVRLWDGTEVDPSGRARVGVILSSPSALRYLWASDLSSLAEGYVEGRFGIDGRVEDAVKAAEMLCRSRGVLPSGARRRPRRHTRGRDLRAVQGHYDLSNDFFSLWLDRRMTYSCAYFRSGSEDIHRAQEQKLDYICRKLMLKPEERFLDIGCGWGALISWAARHYGVKATGITLSRRQYEYACARVNSEGLTGRCQVRLLDYRDLRAEEGFDKIASVGMFEHVGLRNLSRYFAAMTRLLRRGGLFLNHGICSAQLDGIWTKGGGGDFIDRYVFPMGELPHVSHALREMAAQGFEVADVECLRPHYAQTLLHWSRRFDIRLGEAQRLVGERTCRVWSLYLAGCRHAFQRGWISVYQILACKGSEAGGWPLPWSRQHLYEAFPVVRSPGDKAGSLAEELAGSS